MDNQGWKDRWQRREIGFHQPQAHDQLAALWPQSGIAPGCAVFVPLCGKSRDMAWLAGRGHTVVGAELSELAVREFFEEETLSPSVSDVAGFKVFEAGPYRLYCGDIFELPKSATSDVGACYDRAALVAFPPERQSQYARKLGELLPLTAPIFLIALEYPHGEISGPPFSTPDAGIRALFADGFDVECLSSRDALSDFASDALKKRGVTRLEEAVYLLRRRA